jgi:ketosteroid isomerase-like protein
VNGSSTTKALVERFVAACNADGSDPWQHLSPTVVVTIIGSTWFSGRFDGPEQIRRILIDTVRQYLRAPQIRITELIGEGQDVAALIEVSGVTRTGQHFAIAGAPWGACFTMDAGRIVSIDVFPDSMFVESTLCGAIYRPNDAARVLT